LEAQFNASLLLRMEQKESAKQQQQLLHEKKMRNQAQILLLIISVAFIIISGLSIFLYVIWRRKSSAYRELVRKSQEWAQSPVEIASENVQAIPDNIENSLLADKEPDIENDNPNSDNQNINMEQFCTEADKQIFEQMQLLFLNNNLYRDDNVSLEKIAQKMNIHKNYLSRAVNRCAKKNINTYINEYRIK